MSKFLHLAEVATAVNNGSRGKGGIMLWGLNLAERFKMFKKPVNSGQVSNLKALDATLPKSCMKRFARFCIQRGRIQPDLAKFKMTAHIQESIFTFWA